MLHVLMVPAARLVYRVRAGGHDVPEHKLHARYRRLWPLVAEAVRRADTATIYDNSQLAGPRQVAQLNAGTIVGGTAWPTWAPTPLCERWP